MYSCARSQPGYVSNSLVYQRLAQLRQEADHAVERAEAAEAKNKKLEQEILSKEQDIQSLNHRLTTAEGELDKAEGELKEAKSARAEHESSKEANDSSQRKIQLLEEELDNAEKNLKETVERCVSAADYTTPPAVNRFFVAYPSRLRQIDLKAEHFERQVQRLEQERDVWEKKYEVWRVNQLAFPPHTLSIYRNFKPSTRTPRESSTSLSPAWKGYDRVMIHVLPFVRATLRLRWPSDVCI